MAVGLSRLGLTVGLISAVGDDLLADYLLSFLHDEGVDSRFVSRVRGCNTSLCLTEVWPPDHFRQVFYRNQPADARVAMPETALEEIRRAKMFITNGTALAASPSRESALAAMEAAKTAGATTIFDVDYRPSSWPSAQAAGEQARQAIAWADAVLANEEELAMLAPDLGTARATVLNPGPRLLVEKLGARGVAAHTGSEDFFAPSRCQSLVCAVGGGDGFASGFLYALHQGLELPVALAYGNAAAAIVVGRVSCSDAMPHLHELQARLKAPLAANS